MKNTIRIVLPLVAIMVLMTAVILIPPWVSYREDVSIMKNGSYLAQEDTLDKYSCSREYFTVTEKAKEYGKHNEVFEDTDGSLFECLERVVYLASYIDPEDRGGAYAASVKRVAQTKEIYLFVVYFAESNSTEIVYVK